MPNQNDSKVEMLKEKTKVYREKWHVYRDKVLAMPNDSIQKTIAIALWLCLVCAIIVSTAAVALRPMQVANKAHDMKKNILDVVGLLEEGSDIDQAFAQFETKIVDLETGDYVDSIDPAEYDQRKAAKDSEMSITISPNDDQASIRRRAKNAKVYLLKEGDKIKAIILPMHGYGLWSTMYGFLALESDGETVIGINFYDHAETPGLGGEIVNPNWRSLWAGKKVYNDSGDVALRLIKGTVDSAKTGAEYEVDGLAGATLTSTGVTNLVRYWMGAQGFSAYLDKIRSNEG